MKTKITTALAVLLLAGVSTAALAQEHDHDRGDRGPGQGRAQAQQAPRAAQAPAAPAQGRWSEGGRPGGQVNPQAFRDGPREGFRGEGPRGQALDHRNFQGRPPMATPPPQRFERDVGRQWDPQRAPQEVVPPAGGRRAGQFDRRDGYGDGRRWEGRRWDGDRGAVQHWQAGRFPPTYWSPQRYRVGGYRTPYGFYSRSWAFGEFLPRGWYAEDYWLDDFLDYGLPYPPPGYEWVRVGEDALLVDRFTGRIVQVVRAIFW